MSSSPSRAARRQEESTRLLSHDYASNEDAESSGRGRWSSNLPRWMRRTVGQEYEDETLPAMYAKRRPSKIWITCSTYLLLLIIGAILGVLASKLNREYNEKDNEGLPEDPVRVWLPPPTGLPRAPAYLANGTQGAVASEEVTCSNIGLSILRDHNGTAVDAAVTTALCVGTINAFASGIGGGGFMVVRVPEDSPLPDQHANDVGVWAIDFRETSPGKSEKEMYGEKKAGRVAAQNGGLAIGVPGELRGLEMAHKLYGRLPWKDLVMPVAELAKGFEVTRELALRIRIYGTSWMRNFDTWKEVYAPQGYLAVEGDLIRRTNYAKTLARVAQEGASAFYEGDIARQSSQTIQEMKGIIDEEDLRGYQARRYPAIHQTYHNRTIYTTSAPTSGGVMLGLLNVLETYDYRHSRCHHSHLDTHRFLEASKFAFGARSEICDPAFASNLSRFDEFYTKEWAAKTRRRLTDNSTHDYSYYGLQFDTPIDKGTTHLSVIDKWGGAASVTSTVNGIWGSKVMDPKTGVIFNNEQDDFAVPGAPDQFGLQPSPWNYPAPGKKPLSSTAATIILNDDGSLYAILGGSGGSRIFPAIAQVILNLECGLDISESIERPRVHNQVVPDITSIEVGPEGEDKGLSKALRDRGHDVLLFDINSARAEVQGIVVENGTIWAASDSRKHGVAAAY